MLSDMEWMVLLFFILERSSRGSCKVYVAFKLFCEIAGDIFIFAISDLARSQY